MENFAKGMLMVLIILYVISPDPLPGPIDDIIVIIAGLATRKRIGTAED